jgi:hypothetical protein
MYALQASTRSLVVCEMCTSFFGMAFYYVKAYSSFFVESIYTLY